MAIKEKINGLCDTVDKFLDSLMHHDQSEAGWLERRRLYEEHGRTAQGSDALYYGREAGRLALHAFEDRQ